MLSWFMIHHLNQMANGGKNPILVKNLESKGSVYFGPLKALRFKIYNRVGLSKDPLILPLVNCFEGYFSDNDGLDNILLLLELQSHTFDSCLFAPGIENAPSFSTYSVS